MEILEMEYGTLVYLKCGTSVPANSAPPHSDSACCVLRVTLHASGRRSTAASAARSASKTLNPKPMMGMMASFATMESIYRATKRERKAEKASAGTADLACRCDPPPMPPFISPLPPPHPISSCDCSQLQRRLDVRAETSIFAARPLLLWAFRSSQWQLQAVFGPRPSLLRVSAAQSRAFGCHLGESAAMMLRSSYEFN
jgi:hypothetical protein